MNQILYSKKSSKKPMLIVILVVIILIILTLSMGFGLMNLANNKILNGVIVANIDVSNMTKEEAVEAINKLYSESVSRDITLSYEDYEVSVSSDEIGFGYIDADILIEQAYAYGRDGNIFENNFTVIKSHMNAEKRIETSETLNYSELKNVVKDMISNEDIFARDDNYEISGEKLLITKGTEGKKIDYDALGDKVLEALKNREMNVTIPVIVSQPESLDIDMVYQKVRKAPKNATYKENPLEIIKEENGLEFDVQLAKDKYLALSRGETAEIKLVVTKPEVTVSELGDILFKNLIATFTSVYDESQTDRVTNLQVAANRCNNTILYPGDEFSYNKALGHRTVANGYKMGNSFAGGKVVQTVGGGICQVSSTLYNAVLRADLTITDRTAHGMYVKYVPQSTDATVVDNAIDFKFRNDREYPVKIVTICENGVVTASIYGFKDENEPTIEIETKILEIKPYKTQKQNDSTMKKGTTKVVQEPVDGYVSESYKVYYKNGKEISRKLISKDTYQPTNEIIKVGTKVNTPTVTPKPEAPVVPEEPQKPVVVPDEPNPLLPPGWDNPESGY